MSFHLESEPIVGSDRSGAPSCGGLVIFEGRVRDRNEGRSVRALEYEAFEELAVAEGRTIIAEAQARFELGHLWAAHRVGLLELGDVAFRVEAAASHRDAAFEACRWVVDEVKRRVPIWKREHYADGPSAWLVPTNEPLSEVAFFSRQSCMPEMAAGGQARLRKSKVALVGVGGLGCAALPYLVASGIGEISLFDPDLVEASNLHRQVLFGPTDVGRPKISVAASRAAAQSPFTMVRAHQVRIDDANADDLLCGFDLILDGTDNFEAKFALNDFAVRSKTPLVQAALYRFEGQAHLFDPNDPGSPDLRALWPEPPPAGCVGDCAEVGVMGFVPGLLGTIQAATAIQFLAGTARPLASDLLLLDAATMTATKLARTPGASERREESMEETQSRPAWEIDDPGDLQVVDIREPFETAEWPSPYPNTIEAPLSSFDPSNPAFAGPIALLCRRGRRSATLTLALLRAGKTDVFSIAGGMERVAPREE